MATVRRNTYIVEEKQNVFVSPAKEMSGKDRQNLMRLKVNRIALVQELRVEHVIRYLLETGIIAVTDLRKIETGTTPQDRTRLFIDLLPSNNSAGSEWYKHFRHALINPDANAEVRRKYRCLVEFLDNTIIHRPTTQGSAFRDFAPSTGDESHKLPHYQSLPPIKNGESSTSPRDRLHSGSPPNILNLQESEESGEDTSPVDPSSEEERVTTVTGGDVTAKPNISVTDRPHVGSIHRGYIHQWVPAPQDFQSLVEEPSQFFQGLQQSDDPDDKVKLQEEMKALHLMRGLELFTVLYRRKKLPARMELCTCEAVEDILSNPNWYHMFMKYLLRLKKDQDVDLLQDLCESFQCLMTTLQPTDDGDRISGAVKLAFKLTNFFAEFNYFTEAESTLLSSLIFLNKYPKLETLKSTFEGYVKLMQLRNKQYDFKGANTAYFRAVEVGWQIEKMSFGQDILDESEMYLELSHMLLESGSINSAYSWGFKALQHVSPDDHATVVHVLCNAVMTYCSRWNIKRAEDLAVQAVQIANEKFGTRHPLYLKALLTYCYYSNEFRQDQAGLEIAQLTLEVSQKIYGMETLQVAHAHRALCKALVVTGNLDNDDFLHHALEAVKIAKVHLSFTHPMMYLFHFTMAFALHWKGLQVSFSQQEEVLKLAVTEAKEAQCLIQEHFGDISLRNAQILGLLGQIYTKLSRLDEAEATLVGSEKIMGLCLPTHNNYLLVAKTSLAIYYTLDTVLRLDQAKTLLQRVLTLVESPGVKMKWVGYAFEHLISVHQSLKEKHEAAEVEASMVEWLCNNPPYSDSLSWQQLHDTPKPYADFLAGFNIWQKRINRLKQAK